MAEKLHAEAIVGLWEDQAGCLSVCTSKGRLGRIAEERFMERKERLPGDCTVVLQDSADAFWIGLSRKTSALCYYKEGRFHTPDMAGVEAIADVSSLCEY